MLSLEEMEKALQDRVLAEISRRTGLSKPTLIDIKKGNKKRYHEATLKTLSDYLEGKP